MIIDEILDMCESGQKNATLENLKYIYKEAELFKFNKITSGITSGDSKILKEALYDYIKTNNYNPKYKEQVSKINWSLALSEWKQIQDAIKRNHLSGTPADYTEPKIR